MPQAMMYVPPDDKSRQDLLTGDGAEERRARQDQFKHALDYYDGRHERQLYVDDDQPDDNLVINMTKQVVDRTLSFLFPSMPKFQIDPTQVTEDEQWLDYAWRINNGPVLLNGVAYNGALSGHNFIKVVPGKQYPRLISINPANVIVYWKADDKDTVLWYEIKWQVGKVLYIQDIIYNPETETWSIDDWRKETGAWERVSHVDWQYELSPIVDWQHLPDANNFYGKPDIGAPELKFNDDINRIASNINKILRIHAHPRTIVKGANAKQIEKTAVNGLWSVENTDADIFNLEMQSDLQSSSGFLQMLQENFLAQSRVVIMRGSVKDFQRVTNTGIRAVFLDMISKNQLLRWNYGVALQEISRRMLMLVGKPFALRPDVVWADPLPSDDTERINALAIERNLGFVSIEQGIRERNRNAQDQIKQMRKEIHDPDLSIFYDKPVDTKALQGQNVGVIE